MASNKVFQNAFPKLLKAFSLALLFISAFYTQLAFAATADAGTMLMNFVNTVPYFMQLVTASAYVIGMYLIFSGIIGLKKFGESRSMMSDHESLKGPLILMAVGTALLYLPTSVQAGLTTFWSNPNPYGYLDDTTDQWAQLYQGVFLIIQLIGTIAFIRGLLILTQLSGQGQPGTLAKGITHIVAGAICINLYDFLNAVMSTLSLGAI